MTSRSERARWTGAPELPGRVRSEAASGAHISGSQSISPRLVNMRQGAVILGCSFWIFRDYVLQGLIPVVELPPLRPRDGARAKQTLRRVLIDIEDLDRFIESRKRGGAQEFKSPAPQIEAHNTAPNQAAVPALCPDRGQRGGR